MAADSADRQNEIASSWDGAGRRQRESTPNGARSRRFLFKSGTAVGTEEVEQHIADGADPTPCVSAAAAFVSLFHCSSLRQHHITNFLGEHSGLVNRPVQYLP